MPASSATPLRAGDWVYKAEGGRNLVLSYGGEGQGFAGHVLRLSKRRCVAHGHGCGGGGGRGTCGGEVESVGEGKESGVEVAACAGGNGDAEAETEVETETEAEAEAEAEGSSSKVGPGSPGKETGCEESFRYMKETFSPIVRKDLLFMGRLVAVGAHFLSELASICQPMRPSQRLSLEIDTEARSGWLMPDLSTLPRIKSGVVAVEIKPKSCVLPQAHQVCQEHACKAEVSAYAMMQHWKLSKGKVGRLSNYHPPDLFSGDEARMQAALRALLDNPQNNLRAYVDGVSVIDADQGGFFFGRESRKEGAEMGETVTGKGSPEENTLMQALAPGGAEASMPRLEDCRGQRDKGQGAEISANLVDRFCEVVGKLLCHSGVLGEIEALQRVCELDIESVWPMERYLLSECSEEEARASAPSKLPPVAEWDHAVESFLVSQSAKDCSLILAFAVEGQSLDGCGGAVSGTGGRRSHDDDDDDEEEEEDDDDDDGVHRIEHPLFRGKGLVYRCGVVDLDRKPRSKVGGYFEQSGQLVQAYLSSRANED